MSVFVHVCEGGWGGVGCASMSSSYTLKQFSFSAICSNNFYTKFVANSQ